MREFIFLNLLLVLISLFNSFFVLNSSDISEWIHSQGIILGNIELSNSGFVALRDLYKKDLIFSIPLNNTLHPLEDYPFKEYFNISTKDTLIGRIIIEKVLGNESFLYPWIESLPEPSDLKDLFHFSTSELQDFLSRSYEEFAYLKVRKEKYLKIRKNMPLEVLNEKSFNFEIYNWAASIVDSYSCYYELDHFDNSKLGAIRIFNPNTIGLSNLILIPLLEKVNLVGIELQKPGIFNEDYEESPQLFRYIIQKGEKLDVRAQKLIEKGDSVKIIDGKSNREYLQYNGVLLKEDYAKDFLLKFKPDLDMEKIRLCWELNISQKKSLVFSFQLSARSLNINLLLYSKISLMKNNDDYEEEKKELYRKIEDEGVKSKLENYLIYERVLLNKWKEVYKNKTSLEVDMMDLLRMKEINEKQKMNLEFNVNSKQVFLRNVLMVQRKILKELKKDFVSFNKIL